MPPISKKTLVSRYKQLPKAHQAVLQMCSVMYCGASRTKIHACLNTVKELLPGKKLWAPTQTETYLKTLRSKGLLGRENEPTGLIVDHVCRKAMEAGHYDPMSRAVLKEIPNPSKNWWMDLFDRARLRNVRIAVYTGRWQLYGKEMDALGGKRSTAKKYAILDDLLLSDFDLDWYLSLSNWFLKESRDLIINYCMLNAIVPDALFNYGETILKDSKRSVEEARRWASALVMLAVLAGRPDRVDAVVEREPELLEFLGSAPMAATIRGELVQARDGFENELRAMRKGVGDKNAVWFGYQGSLLFLACLAEGSCASLKKGALVAGQSRRKNNAESLNGDIAPSFQAMFAAKNGDMNDAEVYLGRAGENYEQAPRVRKFFILLAGYVVKTTLDSSQVSLLKDLLEGFKQDGADWLALECGAILEQVGKCPAPVKKWMAHITAERGISSLVQKIRIEEIWERSLNALILAGTGDAADGVGEPRTRLVWCVSWSGGRLSLCGKEQKLSRHGRWSKGRAVAMARLMYRDVQNLSPEDEAVCKTIIRNDYSDHRQFGEYIFDWDTTLPALVGHPRIVQDGSTSVSVEFLEGEPELLVQKSGGRLRISLSTRPAGQAMYTVVRETPTRYVVVRWTDKLRQLASIVGPDGLDVPEEAADRVLQAVASISSHVTVQSDIGGVNEELPSVDGDPTPLMHLLPAGTGFRAEMFVRPFVEAGPYLKPGQGTKHVIAEIEGVKTQVVRELDTETALARGIEEQCPALIDTDEGERRWILDGPEECLELLTCLKREQDQGNVRVLWPEGEKIKLAPELTFSNFDLKVHKQRDWFEVSGDLTVGGEKVMNMKSLLELLRATPGRFISLGDDTFLTLSNKLRRRLEELDAYSDGKSKEVRLNPLAALAFDGLDEEFANLETDEHWKARFEQVRSARDLEPEVPSTLKAELRDYQVDGFKWLSRMAAMGLGACLADDMGLGKTVQALALILSRASQGATLVVAPTSVCANWQDEAEKFAPTLNPILFGGKNRKALLESAGPMDLVVSSYGLLQQEAELFQEKQWTTIVLDEAQAIKNATTKRNRAAMALCGEFKVITTGTPLENHLSELHALFSFIAPGLLGSRKRFSEQFAVPVERDGNKEARRRLRKLVRPFILRRIKSEVLEELPARTDVVLKVSMSEEEAAFYEAVRLQSMDTLAEVSENPGENHLRILAEITRLRQAACNPRLVMGDSGIPSAKLEAFGDLVEELRATGHKALVFSQFVSHLNLIREFLDGKKIEYRYLDGSTPAKARKKEVTAFQAGQGDLFLISLKAGGTGLNLTAADYVIHMDPWWNPAVEDQASDRAHRIGQERPVTVYRLVGRGTIEEKIVKLHQEKRELADSLLEGTDMTAKVSTEDLLKLIREGGE